MQLVTLETLTDLLEAMIITHSEDRGFAIALHYTMRSFKANQPPRAYE